MVTKNKKEAKCTYPDEIVIVLPVVFVFVATRVHLASSTIRVGIEVVSRCRVWRRHDQFQVDRNIATFERGRRGAPHRPTRRSHVKHFEKAAQEIREINHHYEC